MTTQTTTLADFLLARIAEDEAAALEIQRRVAASPGSFVSLGLDHPELAAGDCPGYLAEYDPARVLAECEAKRRIVELCEPGDWSAPGWHPIGEPGEDDRGDVLALLALPYADHPDYREEWKP